jgi:circadian clock protein KaiC
MSKSSATQRPGSLKVRKGDRDAKHQPIRKKTTGIAGFDQITNGGLPEGRLTAVIGGPGMGKSLFGLQYLLHRLRTAGERGLFVTFEEPVDRVRSNLAGLDWDFDSVPDDQLSLIDARLPADTVQAGSFDLTGLLAGLSARKAASGASNVVFDGIDLLIGSLNDEHLERRELARIDEWIREEGMSAIVTVKEYSSSEREQKRADLIQYLTDCVVRLEGALFHATFSRTLRVMKYRGSGFAANAVPMAIGQSGVEVIPAEASRGGYPVFVERVSSGVPRLDAILGGGFIRGSSILVSGAPGTAKTSLAASLVAAACVSGRKAVFVSFDESDVQIVANMKSIGVDLARHVASGHLAMVSLRSSGNSPEECFLKVWNSVQRHGPDILVVDPLSAFSDTAYPFAHVIAENLIDLAKSKGITFLGTSLLGQGGGEIEISASHVSTIADTWLHVSYVVQNGERNRALTIVKSRGTAHSNQVRELALNGKGLDLVDVYAGEGKVLLGSARVEKQQEEMRTENLEEITYKRRKFELDHSIAGLKARAQEMIEELASKQREAELEETAEEFRIASRQTAVAQRGLIRRKADDTPVLLRPRIERMGQKL